MNYPSPTAKAHVNLAVLAWCAGTLLVMGGCGDGSPELAPVSGIVEFDGKPIAGFQNAAVAFTPVGGRPAKGIVSSSDGSFELSTYSPGDGARVGAHTVVVSATVDDPSATAEDKYPGVRSVIPEKFANRDTSGLACEVEPGGNFVRIQIRSDGAGAIVKE